MRENFGSELSEDSEGSYSANSIYSSSQLDSDEGSLDDFVSEDEEEKSFSDSSLEDSSERFSQATFSSFDSAFSDLSRKQKKNKSDKGKSKEVGKLDNEYALSKEICATIREHASEGSAVMKLIENRFNTFDKNGNGYLDANEFRQLIVSILGGREVTQRNAQKLLETFKLDTDHSGTISYDEFVSFVSLEKQEIFKAALVLRDTLKKECNEEDEGDIARTYGRYATKIISNTSSKKNKDTDSASGVIESDEFRKMAINCGTGAGRMTAGELQGFMSLMDTEGRGVITASMFRDFVYNYAAHIKSINMSGTRNPSKTKSSKEQPEISLSKDFEASPVSEVKLSVNRLEEEKLRTEGFTRLPSNLNDRGRGKKIYLWYKKSSRKEYSDEKAFLRSRITDIALSRRRKDVSLLSTGFQCVEHSTSEGAWFVRKQYLWIRRNAEDKFPIVDIAVTAGRSKDKASKLWTPPFRGYKRINGDLNKGNRGSQVFLWYFKQSFEAEKCGLAAFSNEAKDSTQILVDRVREQLRNLSGQTNEETGIIDLEKIWDNYDKSNRGWLPRSELRTILKEIGFSLKKKELNEISRILDVNNDNRIDQDEFLEFLAFNPAEVEKIADHVRSEIMKKLKDPQSKSEMKSRLRQFFSQYAEKVRDGKSSNKYRTSRNVNESAISARGFGKVLKKLGIRLTAGELKSLMGRFDKNSDGYIDFKEFSTFIISRQSAQDIAAKRVEAASRKLRAHLRKLAFRGFDDTTNDEPKWEKAWSFAVGEEGRKKGVLTKTRLKLILSNPEIDFKLSDKEIDILISRFGKFGESKDGNKGITKEELIAFASSAAYIDCILNAIVEFVQQMSKERGITKKALFHQLDEDGDGKICKAELNYGLARMNIQGEGIKLTDQELTLVAQRFDQDGDGKISIKEFISYLELASKAKKKATKLGLEDDDAQVVSALSKLQAKGIKHKKRHGDYVGIYSAFDINDEGGFDIKGFKFGLLYLQIIHEKNAEVDSDHEKDICYLSTSQLEKAFRNIHNDVEVKTINYDTFEDFMEKKIYVKGIKKGNYSEYSSDSSVISDLESSWNESFSDSDMSEFAFDSSTLNLCQTLAETLQRRTIKRLNTAFRHADTDGCGTIPTKRFSSCLHKNSLNKISLNQSSKIAKKLDEGDGSVNYTKFYRYIASLKSRKVKNLASNICQKLKVAQKPHKLESWLNRAAGGKNKITRAHLNKALNKIGLKGITSILFEDLESGCRKEDMSSNNGRKVIKVDVLCSTLERLGTGNSSPRSFASDDSVYSVDEDFHTSNKIPQIVANAIDEAKMKGYNHFEASLRMCDSSCTGVVDEVALQRSLRTIDCNLNRKQIKKLVDLTFSRKGENSVDYDALLSSVRKLRNGNVSPRDADNFETIERKVREALRIQQEKRTDLKKQFELLDRNGDGRISQKELSARLPRLLGGSLQLSHQEMKVLLKAFDQNGDGEISLREFAQFLELDDTDIEGIISQLRQDLRSQARRGISQGDIFKEIDRNGDGFLSRREFRLALEKCSGIKLSDNEMRRVMDYFTSGSNGKVDYKTFSSLCAPSEIEVSALEAKLKQRIRGIVCTQARDCSFDVKKAYNLFDVENNGIITRREFQDGCIRLGIALSDSELELLLDRFDVNNDNKVDYFEFSRFLAYDDSEIDELMKRAGRRLMELYHQNNDPMDLFLMYEKKHVHDVENDENYDGNITRREFYTACSDLKMELEESEIFALADMHSENTTNERVNYAQFVNNAFAACGSKYSPKSRYADEEDSVWNPVGIEKWLKHSATEEEKKTFFRVQESMGNFGTRINHTGGNGNFVGRPSDSIWDNNSDEYPQQLKFEYEKTGLWDCPVCFYKQTEIRRKTCAMCDSSNPYVGEKLHWPHIKPLISEAASMTKLSMRSKQFISAQDAPSWNYNQSHSPSSVQTPGEESPRWNCQVNDHAVDDLSDSSSSSTERPLRKSRNHQQRRSKSPNHSTRTREKRHSRSRSASRSRKSHSSRRKSDLRSRYSKSRSPSSSRVSNTRKSNRRKSKSHKRSSSPEKERRRSRQSSSQKRYTKGKNLSRNKEKYSTSPRSIYSPRSAYSKSPRSPRSVLMSSSPRSKVSPTSSYYRSVHYL